MGNILIVAWFNLKPQCVWILQVILYEFITLISIAISLVPTSKRMTRAGIDQRSRAAPTSWWGAVETAHGKIEEMDANARPPIRSHKEHSRVCLQEKLPSTTSSAFFRWFPTDIDDTIKIEFPYAYYTVSQGIQQISTIQ